MHDILISFDHKLFFAINHGLSNPFFDWLMPILRNRLTWIPLYVFLVVFFTWKFGKTGILIIVLMGMTFALTDSISSRLVKYIMERPRPCNDVLIKTQVTSLVPCGTGYSFPSAHAANHFGLALFAILIFYRRWKWVLPVALLWAVSITFAQVYVGVHYPSDILAGAILGCIIAYLTAASFFGFVKKYEWKFGK
jgi:membrane-associated phospholipid phosphatase